MRASRNPSILSAAAVAAALLLSSCGGGTTATVDTETTAPAAPAPSAPATTQAPEPSETPSDPVDEESEDPVVEEEPADEPSSSFTDLAFGETLPVKSEDGTQSSDVTIGKPRLAKCKYASIGCDDLEVGDRVVSIPILIENTGGETMEWRAADFVLEYADGTQVGTYDGIAYQFAPDNALDDVKVRPGGKYKSVLVFEAPKGPFSLLILTNPYDGEPFAAWS